MWHARSVATPDLLDSPDPTSIAAVLELAPATPGRIAVSEVAETAFAVHALLHPEHHPLQRAWTERTARALPARLSPLLDRAAPAFGDGFADAFVCVGAGLPFADGLAALRELTEDEIVDLVPGDDPLALHAASCELLEAFWPVALRDDWPGVRARLDDAAAAAEAQLAAGGVYALLGTLGPRVTPEPEHGRFAVTACDAEGGPPDEPLRLALDRQGVLELHPSLFAWPHLAVAVPADRPPVLTFPVHGMAGAQAPPPDPEALVRLLRACGDDVRLKMLQLLALHPRTTQELSALLHLTPPGVSKHLRTLDEAGLVQRRREGRYVRYAVRADRIAPLSGALLAFLGLNAA